MVDHTGLLRILALFLALVGCAFTPAFEAYPEHRPPTPLEAGAFASLPTSAEIDHYLQTLTARSSHGRLIAIGTSAGGRPLHALCVSLDPAFCREGRSRPGKLSVLLVGSQHGTEPSGAEALQRVAGELLMGALRHYLDTMNFILIVNANPDGRDTHRRVNGNSVNLSTDFILLSQPESRAVVDVLHRFRPHVVLDVHESALFKKSSLGAQGYLTDFEAQFETANNPNIETDLGQWSREHFLPALLDAVTAQGLPARRYIGEITDIHQPVTHGGLSPRTLRNYAGLLGSLSVVVENRLDPPGEDYASHRNIAARVGKQFLSISTFLARCLEERDELLERVRAARLAPGLPDGERLYLSAYYAPVPGQPLITLPLRRLETRQLEPRVFDYHGFIVAGDVFTSPHYYYILAHREQIGELLERHAVAYTRLRHPVEARVVREHIRSVHPPWREGMGPCVALDELTTTLALEPGTLRVDLDGPQARLVPLLLEPRAFTSVFHTPTYEKLLAAGDDFFIVRSADAPASAIASGDCDNYDQALPGPPGVSAPVRGDF